MQSVEAMTQTPQRHSSFPPQTSLDTAVRRTLPIQPILPRPPLTAQALQVRLRLIATLVAPKFLSIILKIAMMMTPGSSGMLVKAFFKHSSGKSLLQQQTKRGGDGRSCQR